MKSKHGSKGHNYSNGNGNPPANEPTVSDDTRFAALEENVAKAVCKDKSPEAKQGRQKMMVRATYGEFMCTLLFYTPIFGVLMNMSDSEDSDTVKAVVISFVGGFQAICVSFAFSSISGAHFNSSISFALWLTGKLSSRRLIGYVFAQLLASVVAMAILSSIFQGPLESAYIACTVTPSEEQNLGYVFATEFFLTFMLAYVAFTVAFEEAESDKKHTMSLKTISDSKGLALYASTPLSRSGFAPFSIGFTIFCLSFIGGSSGGAFNPGRLFGPALFSGKWDYLWLYWIGEVLGASCAGLLVSNLHRFGLKGDQRFGKPAIQSLASSAEGSGDSQEVRFSVVYPVSV
jgi:glycerol uptake facilitator-like aquaporin